MVAARATNAPRDTPAHRENLILNRCSSRRIMGVAYLEESQRVRGSPYRGSYSGAATRASFIHYLPALAKANEALHRPSSAPRICQSASKYTTPK